MEKLTLTDVTDCTPQIDGWLLCSDVLAVSASAPGDACGDRRSLVRAVDAARVRRRAGATPLDCD